MEEPWMMFTKTQAEELITIKNTTHIWISINEVNGYKFTNKKDSSKYIFLPAAGNWSDMSHNNAGSWGNYWSTVISPSDNPYGTELFFRSDAIYTFRTGNYRTFGYSIRPVRQW